MKVKHLESIIFRWHYIKLLKPLKMNQILQRFSLEYLIRLSGETNIKALEFGIKNGLNRVGIIISEEKKDKIVKILGQPTNPKVGNKNFIIEYFEINDINNKIETQKKIFEKIALLETRI